MSSWEKEGENESGIIGLEGLGDIQWLPSGQQLRDPGLRKVLG